MWSLSFRFLQQNRVHSYTLSHTCYIPRPSNFSGFDHPKNIWWKIKIIKLLIMYFLYSPISSSILGPNILLSTLFTNTLNLRSSISVSDQVSHSHKQQIKLYFCVSYSLYFWLQPGRHKILHGMVGSIPWLQSALSFFMNGILIC